MKITALIENISHSGMPTEHGLSLYIETENANILFDMGQTDLFYDNAKLLGIDLAKVDFAVLSHGHYDHGGGLAKFLEINKKSPVYLSEYAFEPHYNGSEKYIGLDVSIEGNKRLIAVSDSMKITENATVFSCKENGNDNDLGSFGLNMIQGGVMMPDDFRHEQYLLIEENGKIILFSGCSHKSVLDIEKRFKPDIFIGGFHFSKIESEDELSSHAEFLDRFDTDYYTCHCTGVQQFECMKKHMTRLNYLSCGQTIEI